ncbi:MAG: hypothetical protein AB7F35_18525 [Acetobacteraceae bacterium]
MSETNLHERQPRVAISPALARHHAWVLPDNLPLKHTRAMPSPDRRMLQMGGMIVRSPSDAIDAFPGVWEYPCRLGTARNIWRLRNGGLDWDPAYPMGDCPPGLRRVEYRRLSGLRPKTGWAFHDPATIPDPHRWLAARLGTIAWVRDAGPAHLPPAPPLPADTLPPLSRAIPMPAPSQAPAPEAPAPFSPVPPVEWMLAEGGVVLSVPADIALAYSWRWTTPAAAQAGLADWGGVDITAEPGLLIAEYVRAIPGAEPARCAYCPVLVPRIDVWLAHRIGRMAWVRPTLEHPPGAWSTWNVSAIV